MEIRNFLYKLRKRINLQFFKHSWLDIKRDKAKAIFGISGIAISLFLLTTIGMLNDTVNYNYLLYVTSSTGKSDIMITRTIQTDLTYDPFFDENIINNELKDIEGVEELFPRIMMLVETTSENINTSGTLQLYGLDFIKEASNGNMGDLIIVDDEGSETNEIYDDEPDIGECVILWNVAELLNVSRGDTINLKYQTYELNLSVSEICVQDLKFMQFENTLILINLEQAQSFLEREGLINFVVGTIINPKAVYDASNLDLTTRRLRNIGANIQERLDINEFTVNLPKLEELEGGEFLLMTVTIMFWFITILSTLITGILINSILSTSVEERVREFGIVRVVGSKKAYCVKMVLFEGLMLGLIGSIIGMILGYILMIPIAQGLFPLYQFQFEFAEVEWVIQPDTILMVFSIGTLVSLGISLLPALKTAKLNLIKSITPFQTKEEGWEVKKEGSMNVKSFLVGIAIAMIGMVVFVLMPNIFITGDFMLTSALFIGLLAAIVIGLVFASIGIIPLIQKIFLGIISPAIRKYRSIINISLKRYRRRNTSTVLMFAISFSFIFFITSVTEMESENMNLNLRFQYGADLVLMNQGLLNPEEALTLEMVEELETLPGISKLAITLHNTFDLQATLATIFEISEGQVGFTSESTEQMMTMFQFFVDEDDSKLKTTAGDLMDFDVVEAGFIGINEDFVDLIDKNLLIWQSDGSSTGYSFNELFTHNNTCIIAKSIADYIGVKEVGQYIRLTFYKPEDYKDEPLAPGNVTLFRVVGISGGIPGFYNFRSNEMAANGGGVMVSLENYMRLMKIENPGEPDMIVDKIFINLVESSEENIKETKDDIRTMYQDKNIIIDDAISKINFFEAMTERQSFLMELILTFTIIISIFGLVSSMYAIVLERKFEIGILRSMGMKTRNVRNMFLIESMITLLSAGVMGTIIGTFTGYLLESTMALMSEMPVIFSIPWDTLTRTFILSISFAFLGTYIILIKYFYKKSIMDIFRQTF
ncbi:MAG: FtsX-like permease family protein [Promethearchaeota archaeon]|nr:MAG: FtsX-like permease family protein [Candidatus Lokiarchaeota archaeon]